MAYYDVCEICGSNLDPGEKCNCLDTAKMERKRLMSLFDCDRDGQIRMKVEDFEYAGNQCIS